MNRNPTTVFGIFAATALLLIVLGCDAFVAMRGRVLDQDRRPVVGATVTIASTGEPDIYTTDENGSFTFFDHTNPIGSETFRVSISKDGYVPIVNDEIDSQLIRLPNVNAQHNVEFVFTLTAEPLR